MDADQTSSEQAGSNLRQANCPRCGYDLRGTTRAWRSACDLAGTCPECGLRFDWADLLRDDRARLAGFVEHPGRGGAWMGGAFLARAARTWIWALWPSRFFARVKMHHRFSLARMLIWLPALCATVYLAAAACTLAGGLIYHGSGNLGRVVEQSVLGTANDLGANVLTFSPRWQVFIRWNRHGLPIYLLPAAAAGAMVPVLILAIPVSRRRARVRAAHVLRAAVYGCAWIVPLFALRLINRAGMVVLVAADR